MTALPLHQYGLADLDRLLVEGKTSSEELTHCFLDRISHHDGKLNSFITVTAESALAQAREADRRRAAGDAGPLCGVPMAHKDIFCTDGVRTSCGSRMLDNFLPPYDATVVSRLKQAGMVSLGKLNMDEFAMGSSTESSFYGPARNPWDHERVPGGSSGGSASAVAARLVPAATGTDTGGSIRQPAALCGLTGLKPTYGLVSRFGMIAFASSLDQGGPMTQSAEDAALMLNAMAGFDPHDSTSLDRPGMDYTSGLAETIQGIRIGIPRQYLNDEVESGTATCIREALAELERAGAKLSEIDLPNTSLSIPAYYVIAPAEASSNLSRFDGVRFGYRCENAVDLNDLYTRSRAGGFGSEVKRRIMTGTYVLSAGYYDAYYIKAQQIRRMVRDDFSRAYEEVDLIVGPTTPAPAFRLGELLDDPVQMYLSDIFTVSVNLAGLPAISIPAGFSNGLPVGLQIIGNYFSEAKLLNIAHRYQLLTDWHKRIPTGYA